MENRYKLPKHIQIQYLRTFESTSGLKGEDIASLFGVVSRSYRDWRRGKFAIPDRAIKIIEHRYRIPFPVGKVDALNRWQANKKIAAKKGARAALAKYGALGSDEGRRKGGKRAMEILRARGLIPQPKPFNYPLGYSSELAEFVGMLLGDGHVGQGQWSITVNRKADRIYAEFINTLVQRLFGFIPSCRTRYDCSVIVISGSGIRSIQYLTSVGLKIGNKVKQQVGVPDWIQKNDAYRTACLRGLIDTDGGIFYHRYTVHGKMYIYKKLAFANRSLPLLHFAMETLKHIGLTPKIIDKIANKRVWLYNQTEVVRYLDIIGTHNPRLTKAYDGGVR